jgi:hypothetical protein
VYTFEKPSSKIYDLRDALAKLLIEKGLITKVELMEKLLEERALVQPMLQNVSRGH